MAFETYSQNTNWFYWNNLTGEYANIDINERLKSFIAISRYSVKMMEAFRSNINKSSGYCEEYFSTLVKIKGLTYNVLPNEMVGTISHMETVRLSNLSKNNDNKLYHKFVYEQFTNK